MLSRSDWRSSQSEGLLIVAKTLVSSAKLVMLLSTLFEISLIRTRKSTGPSTVPCGTPLRTLSLLLTPPGILTWSHGGACWLGNYAATHLDWRQCGNSLALCYFAVVMELPDSLWMNCKSEFGVIFLRCSPT